MFAVITLFLCLIFSKIVMSTTFISSLLKPCVKSKKRKIGAAIYNSKFNPKWEEDWPCITAGSTPYHFWCTVCRRELECKHSGRADVVRHFKRDYHKKKLKFYEKLLGSSLKLNMTVIPETGEMDRLEAQVIIFDWSLQRIFSPTIFGYLIY